MEARKEKTGAELKDENDLSLRRQQTALRTPQEVGEGQPEEQEIVNMDVDALSDTIEILENTDRILSNHQSQLTQVITAYDNDVKEVRGKLASITEDLKRKLCSEKRNNTSESTPIEVAEEPQPGPSGMQQLSPKLFSTPSSPSWPEWLSRSGEGSPAPNDQRQDVQQLSPDWLIAPSPLDTPHRWSSSSGGSSPTPNDQRQDVQQLSPDWLIAPSPLDTPHRWSSSSGGSSPTPNEQRQDVQRLSPDWFIAPSALDTSHRWSSSSGEGSPTINPGGERRQPLLQKSAEIWSRRSSTPEDSSFICSSSSSGEDSLASQKIEHWFEGVRSDEPLPPEPPAKRRRPDSPAVWF